MIYLQLFLSFFKIGLFGFGGGYAILSLIQSEIAHYGWMTSQEFTDMVAISQMTPGPIGINAATYVGYTSTGSVLGAAVATFAIILPSLIIMLVLCNIYLRLKNNRCRSSHASTQICRHRTHCCRSTRTHDCRQLHRPLELRFVCCCLCLHRRFQNEPYLSDTAMRSSRNGDLLLNRKSPQLVIAPTENKH